MYTQWKQLSPERQTPGAREIERLPAVSALGFNVDLKVKNFGHFQASIIDFNAESLAVDITALAELGKLESRIESITIYSWHSRDPQPREVSCQNSQR